MKKNLIARYFSAFLLGAVLSKAEPAIEKQTDGVVFALDNAFLKIEVRADNVVRVAYAKDQAFFARPSLVVQPQSGPAQLRSLWRSPSLGGQVTALAHGDLDGNGKLKLVAAIRQRSQLLLMVIQ